MRIMVSSVTSLAEKYGDLFWAAYRRFRACSFSFDCDCYNESDNFLHVFVPEELSMIDKVVWGVESVIQRASSVFMRGFTSKKRKEHLLTHYLDMLGGFAMWGLFETLKIDPEGIYEDFIKFLVMQNRIYGDENLLQHGFAGGFVRLRDKISRLDVIYGERKTDTLAAEKIEDAWRDILGYSINLLRLYDEGRLSLYGKIGRL